MQTTHSFRRLTGAAASWLLIAAVQPPLFADDGVIISPAHSAANGVLVHTVSSPYQSGKTEIRVLLPDRRRSGRRYRVVYILPVEPTRESRYGDGLLEVKRENLHNKYEAVFVAPTFSDLPWYTDHPTQARVRQESYFVKVVVPFVDKTYPTSGRARDRLLVGFSKSGWGAWTLLLRHPETFGRAAAWDAPLMMESIGKYGNRNIFGSQRNFERYRVADLLKQRVAELRPSARLILTGYGNFRSHHQAAHGLLEQLKVPHIYRDGPRRKHRWDSGWLPGTVQLLLNGEKIGNPAKRESDTGRNDGATATDRFSGRFQLATESQVPSPSEFD